MTRVLRKLNIDAAPAMMGWDFSGNIGPLKLRRQSLKTLYQSTHLNNQNHVMFLNKFVRNREEIKFLLQFPLRRCKFLRRLSPYIRRIRDMRGVC